jgi:hypothetical protein
MYNYLSNGKVGKRLSRQERTNGPSVLRTEILDEGLIFTVIFTTEVKRGSANNCAEEGWQPGRLVPAAVQVLQTGVGQSMAAGSTRSCSAPPLRTPLASGVPPSWGTEGGTHR